MLCCVRQYVIHVFNNYNTLLTLVKIHETNENVVIMHVRFLKWTTKLGLTVNGCTGDECISHLFQN